MKKKLTALTLSLVLAFSLVACGGEEKKTETAKTNATTETSVASTEKTEEVAPVAEKSEPEVVEETPEEIIEKEIPTDVRGIESYFMENGEAGDYIISEDNILVLKIDEHRTRECPIKIINDKIYKDSGDPTLQDATSISTYDYYLDPNHKIDYHDHYMAIKGRLDEGIHINVRAEYTDDPNLIKMSYVFPDGTIDWIKNDVVPMNYKEDILKYYTTNETEYEFNNWIYFGPNNDPRNDQEPVGVLIPIDEIQNDTITFVSSRDNFINNETPMSDKEWLTSETLTILMDTSNVSIVFDVPADKIDAYGNYTLVTD